MLRVAEARETTSDTACGVGTRLGCKKQVPSGEAHIVLDMKAGGHHVMFCPGCCPCVTGQPRVRRWR